jgi:hydroxypyruvate isomerase
MPDRREFLAASGLALAALAGGWAGIEADSTWLTYAPDLERFWSKEPFLDRLRKLGEAGFSRYEFARWKTKDFGAIIKRNDELNLQAAIFTGSPPWKGASWKKQLLESGEESAQLAPKLGAGKMTVVAPDRDEKLDRRDQVEDFVDALKETVEKLAGIEVVLILEPTRAIPNRPTSLVASIEEAAAVVKAVGSDKVKIAFTIDPAAVVNGEIPALIERYKGEVNYYRLGDFAPPVAPAETRHAQVLRAIQGVGYQDPIGLGLAAKGDPLAAIESIRKLDATAKAL